MFSVIGERSIHGSSWIRFYGHSRGSQWSAFPLFSRTRFAGGCGWSSVLVLFSPLPIGRPTGSVAPIRGTGSCPVRRRWRSEPFFRPSCSCSGWVVHGRATCSVAAARPLARRKTERSSPTIRNAEIVRAVDAAARHLTPPLRLLHGRQHLHETGDEFACAGTVPDRHVPGYHLDLDELGFAEMAQLTFPSRPGQCGTVPFGIVQT